MLKIEKQKQALLFALGLLRVCSTPQLARLSDSRHPQKRASETLKALESEGLVEGRARAIGESKIWRLTRKARKQLEITKRAIPLTYRNIAHVLYVGDVYFELIKTKKLSYFEIELRERFTNKRGASRNYCPDAFFVFGGEPYFLEAQRSYLSKLKWAEKWKIANDFFAEDRCEQCSVRSFLNGRRPTILTITDQSAAAASVGCDAPLLVFSSVREWLKT